MNTVPHSAQSGNAYTVYALIDPRDNAVRYIGITDDVYARMRQHSRLEGTNAAKDAWVRGLQEEQIVFIMRSLEKAGSYHKALEREQYWINHYLQQGAKLTNISGTSAIAGKRLKSYYKPEEFTRLFFHACTGRTVSIERATDEEFDEFIKRYVEVDDAGQGESWPDWQRRRFVNHILKRGGEIDFCDPVPEEDDGKFRKLGR